MWMFMFIFFCERYRRAWFIEYHKTKYATARPNSFVASTGVARMCIRGGRTLPMGSPMAVDSPACLCAGRPGQVRSVMPATEAGGPGLPVGMTAAGAPDTPCQPVPQGGQSLPHWILLALQAASADQSPPPDHSRHHLAAASCPWAGP